jgi:hypothetical protein
MIRQMLPENNSDILYFQAHPDGKRHFALFRRDDGQTDFFLSDDDEQPIWDWTCRYPDVESGMSAVGAWLNTGAIGYPTDFLLGGKIGSEMECGTLMQPETVTHDVGPAVQI